MNRRIRLGMTFTLALLVLRTSAFSQAAAESALLTAGSSTATVKAGSALSSILSQTSQQFTGRIQRQVLHPTPGQIPHSGARLLSTIPVKGKAVRAGTTSAAGPVIVSIQGAMTSCIPTNQSASAPGSKTAAQPIQTNCGGQNSASQPTSSDKSVIFVSFSDK